MLPKIWEQQFQFECVKNGIFLKLVNPWLLDKTFQGDTKAAT